MAYSDNFPAVRPVFQADFANGGRIDPRATFSRASTGTFFGTDKVLSSENLLLQSEDFHTTWTVADAGRTAGVTAPDGGSNASTLTSNTGSNISPRLNQSLSGKLSTNTQYTMVGHVKAGTATHGYISFRGNNVNNYAYAQIEFASPGSVSTGGAGFSGISGTVTALGSSWYRLTLTATTGSDVSGAFAFLGVNDGTAFGISGYPVWSTAGETLDVWGAQISTTQAKVYDSPTTTQIARSYQTKLQTAASGAARFEHSATDGQSEGILIEGQSTNLLKESTDFSGSWQIINATKSLEAIAPNGALNAIAFREGTNSDQKRLLRYFDNAGPNLTISIYAKLLGNTRRLVIREANATGATAWFDLVSATASSSGVIQSVGGGWYRCSLTIASSSTPMAAGFYIVPANGTLYTDSQFAGDGYSGLLLGMPQAEQQSFSSSWISTTSSTATRAADSLSVATADIGYTGGPVSVVGEASFLSSTYGSSPQLFDLNDNTSSNKFAIYRSSGANGLFSSLTASGAFYGTTTALGTAVANTNYKFAATLSSSRQASCVNGGTVGEDTSVVLPTVTTLDIGNDYNGGAELDGHIKRIAIYNEALSDTNLQALTS